MAEIRLRRARQLRNMNDVSAAEGLFSRLRGDIALKADRAGLDMEPFLEICREEIRMKRGGVPRQPKPQVDHSDLRFRQLSLKVEEAERTEVLAASEAELANRRFRAAKRALIAAQANFNAYARGRG